MQHRDSRLLQKLLLEVWKKASKTHWSWDSDNAVQIWVTRKHISAVDRPVWAKHSESPLFFNLKLMPSLNLMIKATKTIIFCKLWRLLMRVTVGKRLWHPYPFQPVQVHKSLYSFSLIVLSRQTVFTLSSGLWLALRLPEFLSASTMDKVIRR